MRRLFVVSPRSPLLHSDKVLSEDIHLLKQIRVTLDTSKISIVDARSLLNAKANQVNELNDLDDLDDLNAAGQ